MNDLTAVDLAATSLAAVALGVTHTLLLAWLTRHLIGCRWPRSSARLALTLCPLLPRLGLALLVVLALWLGGIGAGLGAVAGFWLGRTSVMLTARRLSPE